MRDHPSVYGKFAAFFAGLLTVVLLQEGYGWWLDSGAAVLRTSLVLLLVSTAAAAWHGPRRWDGARAIWFGATAGSAGALFWIGPGNLWPIVLASAAVIIAASVAIGTLLGASVTLLRG